MMLRADLHVHTWHSKVSGTLPFLGSRDCYSRPEDVYRVAKARGMDLVAITDHDSIDGALELLDRHPDSNDIIAGEEITCWLPEGRIEVHIAAYEMTEALHRDVQALSRNVFDVTARLREAGVLFALNHLLHFYRGQTPLDSYLRLLDEVPALEVRNGTMVRRHNVLVEQIASEWTPAHGRKLAGVAGSDAHTLRRVGLTWTSAPGSTRDEFLSNVAAGLGVAGGAHGGVGAVAGDAYGVVGRYVAALAGGGPRDVTSWRRAACLAFAGASVPFQFVPLVIAASRKAAERREVDRARAAVSAITTKGTKIAKDTKGLEDLQDPRNPEGLEDLQDQNLRALRDLRAIRGSGGV
jgi:predicted metal-dependent phosphoesterase TrpH